MSVRKILLVVNPTGGVRNGLEILKNIKPIFEAGGIELEIIETKYAGHAKDIARAMDIEKFDSLCLVGGDGTMHESINGMYTREDGMRIPVGLIPAGTGNSLMHDFNCLDPSVATKWSRISSTSSRVRLKPAPAETKRPDRWPLPVI